MASNIINMNVVFDEKSGKHFLVMSTVRHMGGDGVFHLEIEPGEPIDIIVARKKELELREENVREAKRLKELADKAAKEYARDLQKAQEKAQKSVPSIGERLKKIAKGE